VTGISDRSVGVHGHSDLGIGVYGSSQFEPKYITYSHGVRVVDTEHVLKSSQRAARFDGPVEINGDLIINGRTIIQLLSDVLLKSAGFLLAPSPPPPPPVVISTTAQRLKMRTSRAKSRKKRRR
jgi:hypothetical protein